MTSDSTESGPTRLAIAQLEALASDLAERGYQTSVSHGSEAPSLSIINPATPTSGETVTVAPADGDTWWFWWSWGDRIARTTDVEAAAFKIAYVMTLRTGG